jgi:hypothetical protein
MEYGYRADPPIDTENTQLKAVDGQVLFTAATVYSDGHGGLATETAEEKLSHDPDAPIPMEVAQEEGLTADSAAFDWDAYFSNYWASFDWEAYEREQREHQERQREEQELWRREHPEEYAAQLAEEERQRREWDEWQLQYQEEQRRYEQDQQQQQQDSNPNHADEPQQEYY